MKGIKDHISGVQSSHDTWEVFASVMAASVVANILHDPMIFKTGAIMEKVRELNVL